MLGDDIRNPDTAPGFRDIPLARIITDQLGVPRTIDNDAASAAIGEYTHGAGRGSDPLPVVTLGTGIGVGVAMIAHGRLVRAGDGSHPEAGHIEINGPAAPCYCGLSTCWEQLASRTALDRLTHDTSDQVTLAARTGSEPGDTALDQSGERVGAGLATLMTIFNANRVLLDGGGARYLDLFHTAMHQRLARTGQYAWAPPRPRRRTRRRRRSRRRSRTRPTRPVTDPGPSCRPSNQP